jgi:hypothetical protein
MSRYQQVKWKKREQLTENNVSVIEPRHWNGDDKELQAIGVLAAARH